MRSSIATLLAGVISLSMITVSHAQTETSSPEEPHMRVDQQQLASSAPLWADLVPEQRELLDNLAERFDLLPAQRRILLAKGSAQYLTLSPEQQTRLRKMVRKFRKMSAVEKREKCRLYAKTHKQVPFFCENFIVVE